MACVPTYKGMRFNSMNELKSYLKQQSQNKFSSFTSTPALDQYTINAGLKVIDLLSSDRAKAIFSKGAKNNWTIEKTLNEIGGFSSYKQLFNLQSNTKDVNLDELILNLSSSLSYSIEVNLGKRFDYSDREYDGAGGLIAHVGSLPSADYENLTAPGGTNYREYDIRTPEIVPIMQSHAAFTQDPGGRGIPTNSIGWFRSDIRSETISNINIDIDVVNNTSKFTKDGKEITKEEYDKEFELNTERVQQTINIRRILEVQSEFQKTRDIDILTGIVAEEIFDLRESDGDRLIKTNEEKWFLETIEQEITDDYDEDDNFIGTSKYHSVLKPISNEQAGRYFDTGQAVKSFNKYAVLTEQDISKNQFLQLLNKESNWINFFIKTIVQDSALREFKKVVFPTGETAAKIEGHGTIADEIRRIDKEIELLQNDKATIDKFPTLQNPNKFDSNEDGLTEHYYKTHSVKGDKYYKSGLEITKNEFDNRYNTIKNEAFELYNENVKYILENKIKEKQDLKSQGIEKLKPIEAFYENRIGNILKKLYNAQRITDEYENDWWEVEINEERDLQTIKFSSYLSTLNTEQTGSNFSEEEERNVISLMTAAFIEISNEYKNLKVKDIAENKIRQDILANIGRKGRKAAELGQLSNSQKELLFKLRDEVRNNDAFWKLFKVQLSQNNGYNIHEIDDYQDEVEYLSKSWDENQAISQHPILTVSDRIKNLINTTPEIDPNNITIDNQGNYIFKSNIETPTGFANYLNYNELDGKIRDLMSTALNKQEMLDILFNFASNSKHPIGKSLLQVWQKLKSDPDLLNTWFTQYDKAIIDSYIDLNRTTYLGNEIDLDSGNRNSFSYVTANKWIGTIISRAENNIFNDTWIKEWNDAYKALFVQTRNFTVITDQTAEQLSMLFDKIGIEIDVDTIMHQYNLNRNNIINKLLNPLLYIKSDPFAKEANGFIELYNKNNKLVFNQFGRLRELADVVKFLRIDHFNHSSINTKGNLIFDPRNPSFISNFFEELRNGTDESIFAFLSKYALVPSNQHSLILWGDRIDNSNLIEQGRGILNYTIEKGKKIPLGYNSINKHNLSIFKNFVYQGSKNRDDNKGTEYSDLARFDWTLKSLVYYLAGGRYKYNSKKEIVGKETAIMPLLNPSDRKHTMLFEVPIIELNNNFYSILSANIPNEERLNKIKDTPIFKALFNVVIDEMIAMQTAKEILFELNEDGSVIIEDGKVKLKSNIADVSTSTQKYYHYKLDENQNKNYLSFKLNENNELELDLANSGNVFSLQNMSVINKGKMTTFNDFKLNGLSFTEHLLNSPSLAVALSSDMNGTNFKSLLENYVLRFIQQQTNTAISKLGIYYDYISNSYLRNENRDVVYSDNLNKLLKNKTYNTFILEYALNTYLFNIEQTRLFHGSIADYISQTDLNKRAGEVLANGLSNSNPGVFYASTVSDVVLKSKIYNELVRMTHQILDPDGTTTYRINKLNKVYTDEEIDNNIPKLSAIELKIYNITSPYLRNDSADSVSLITFEEFINRIKGFGLYDSYKDIIDKVRDKAPLNRDEISKFAAIQKNFFYDFEYSHELQKMVPVQIKNAEIVLTPDLIKDLDLSTINKLMKQVGIGQLNFASAEKVGSLHIGTVTDKKGKLLDDNDIINELTLGKRPYNYKGLHMQLEIPDHILEEVNTLGRQIAKKIILNINDNTKYNINGVETLGKDLKTQYFDLLNNNIWHSANKTMLPFDVSIDNNGNIVGEIEYEKILEVLQKEAINRGLPKNVVYSLNIGNNGYANLPIFFSPFVNKFENLLTSIITNGVTNQKFPGVHAAQMSSVFMNKKKGVKQSELENTTGINWHNEITSRNDLKLRSNITFDENGVKIIEAEVLLPRWSKYFYKEGELVDINTIPDKVRTMIGYRIPTEAKYSMYVFKVVGFLPDSNSPAIVLPDEFITQTGSDFDMDTVYSMLYNLQRKYETIDGVKSDKISTIEYITGTTENDLNNRVTAILDSKEDLIHVLSQEHNVSTIISILTDYNNLIKQYKEQNTELNNYIQNDARLTQVVNKIRDIEIKLTKSKGKNKRILLYNLTDLHEELFAKTQSDFGEAFINYKSTPEYIALKNKVKAIIENWSISAQNTKRARENQIVDIYYSILTNPAHFLETIFTSSFDDIQKINSKINKVLFPFSKNSNILTFAGQQEYRDKSQQSVNLKGTTISIDRFNAIAQIARITLANNIDRNSPFIGTVLDTLPIIEYEITNEIDKKELIKNYKQDVRFETRNNKEYAIVTHRYLTNNPANTFVNVLGKHIDTYSAQITANVLDAGRKPLPNNVNEYTLPIWKLLVSIGSTYDVSTTLINQPIVRELSEFFFDNLHTIQRGREISIIKTKYQTILYKLINKRTGKSVQSWDNEISKGKNIFIPYSDEAQSYLYGILGYKNNTPINIEFNRLFDNLNTTTAEEIDAILKSDNADKARLEQLEQHIRYQLQLLETFKVYKHYAQTITDAVNIFNTDSIGAGPTFTTTNSLEYSINRFAERGLLDVGTTNAAVAIYPKYFGINKESVYPILEQFLTFSNLLSLKAFSNYFLSETDVVKYIKSEIFNYINQVKYDKQLSNRINKYLTTAAIKDLPWLNTMNTTEKHRILGINTDVNLKVNTRDLTNISAFEELSAANQIKLLLDQRNYNSNHILNYLDTKLLITDIERNGYHLINLIPNDIPNAMTESFTTLWYSDDIYERVLARNLVKYEYLTSGFTFGFNSYSKLLPVSIFSNSTEAFIEGTDNEKGINLSSHLESKLRIATANKLTLAKENEINELIASLFGIDYFDMILRTNWRNNLLVPDGGVIKEAQFTKIRDFQGDEVNIQLPLFRPNNNGIISIPANKWNDINTSRAWNNVRKAKFIKLQIREKDKVEWIVFKQVIDYVNIDENDQITGTYYYYPVPKLNENEVESKSIFPNNNQLPDGTVIASDEIYRELISKMREKDIISENVYPNDLAMNMSIKDGKFRDELKEYTTTLDLVRAGHRTATTRHGNEAKKWEKLKIGQFVRLQGTSEYIQITRTPHKIDLSTLAARKEWSAKEGWDISYIHDNHLDAANDLQQFEYKYIGTIDKLLDNAVANDNASGIEEEIDINTKGTHYTWSRYSTKSYEVSSAGDKRFSAFYAILNPGAQLEQLHDTTGQLSTLTHKMSIEEYYQVSVKGYLSIKEGKGKPALGNITREQQWNAYLNAWREWAKQNPELIRELSINARNKVLTDKFATSNINQARALAEILNELYPDNPQLSIKFSSYTSSPVQSVNNAINTADQLIKRIYGNLPNLIRINTANKQAKELFDMLKGLGLEREITEIGLANFATALTATLQYASNVLLSKPDNKFKGGLLIRLDEYENANMTDIINDPIKRKEFTGFMSKALSFLKGWVHIKELTSVDGDNFIEEERIINNLIKELQNLSTKIDNANNKFNKLLESYYEAELLNYTSNPEILDGLRKIFEVADDESYVQLWLDALSDTNNAFVANLVKKFSIAMNKGKREGNVDIVEFENLLIAKLGKPLTAITEADFIKYLEIKNGKRTGKLVQKYNWEQYYTDKANRFRYLTKTYGKGTPSYINGALAWFRDNEITAVSDEEVQKVISQKQEELIEYEFNEWKKRNFIKKGDKTYVRMGDSMFKTPSDKYINPEWKAIKDDPIYSKLTEIISKYTDYFGRKTILNDGFIPTMSAFDKENMSISEKLEAWYESHAANKKSDSFVGMNDELVYILGIPMVQFLGREEEIKFRDRRFNETLEDYEKDVLNDIRQAGRGSFNSLAEVRDKNKKIRAENIELNAKRINYNLYEVFSNFIREANIYKAKMGMKFDIDASLHRLRQMDFNKRNSKNELLKNKLAGRTLDKTVIGTKKGQGTNLEKHLAEWIEAIYYGNFDIDEGTFTKLAKIMIKYSSAKNMWFNITAGVNNIVFGKIQNQLESVAGWYFNNADLTKADKMYIAAIPDMINTLGKLKSGTLTNALIKYFDITQNTNEKDYTSGMLKKDLLSTNSMYFMNDIGEHYLQNTTLFAMLNQHRIINGKIVSLAKYKYNNYRQALNEILSDIQKERLNNYISNRFRDEEFKETKKDYLRDFILSLPLNQQNAFIEARKKLDSTAVEEFNKYPRFIDAFILNQDGIAELKSDVKLDEHEIDAFKVIVLKVVQKEQGIYNREDSNILGRRAMGKMIMQFKKFMRPGWNKRFGSKFGSSYWTESRDEWDKGSYVSLFQFLKGTSGRNRYDENGKEIEFRNMISRLLSDFSHFTTNIRLYWNTLDDFEQGNVRRALLDMVYLCAVLAAGFVLKSLKPDDDDDENYYGYDFTVYQVDRLLSELMFYTPFGLINEGQKILKSPAAVQSAAIDIYKTFANLVSYPFVSDEQRIYQSGIYAKDSKLKVNAIKLVPILNKVQQLQRIDKFNKYYILFRG